MRVLFLVMFMTVAAGCHVPRPTPTPPPAFSTLRPGSVVTVVFSETDAAGHSSTMRIGAVVQRIDPAGVAVIGAEKRAGDGGLWFTSKCPVNAVSSAGEVRREDLYDFHYSSRAGGSAPVTRVSDVPAY